MKWRVIIICGLLFGTTAIAGDEESGTQSPFAFGAGARELALGSSSISSCDPVVAPFWNPSRLASVERIAVGGFHTSLFGDGVAYQYFGLVVPTLDYGSFGLGVFRLGVSDIEKRDAGNLLTGTFDESRLAFYVAYGRQVSNYSIGAAISLEHLSLAGYSASSSPGLHASIGRTLMLSHGRLRQLDVTVNLRNVVAPGTKLLDENVNYPFAADVSASLHVVSDADNMHRFILTSAAGKDPHTTLAANAGCEYAYSDILALRVGVHDSRLTLGGGIHYANFSFDYALVQRPLGSTQLFSLTSAIGASIEDRKQERVKRHEAEFKEAMSRQMESQNRRLAEDFSLQGKAFLVQGALDSAIASFDRALFLARAAGSDTTELVRLVTETQNTIQVRDRETRLSECLDSARTMVQNNRPLQAQYYARLALQADSTSEEATKILVASAAILQQAATESAFVEQRLLEIDSLLAYDHVEDAARILRSLTATAGQNPQIAQAERRIRFAECFERAQTYTERNDFTRGLASVDSALAIFPGHGRCLQLRQECVKGLSAIKTVGSTPTNEPPAVTSAALSREVEDLYRRGQEAFTGGKLADAVTHWERVEKLCPKFKQVRNYLIDCYKFLGVERYSQNSLSEALEYWAKAAALDPNNAEIASYVARAKTEMQKLKALSYEPN